MGGLWARAVGVAAHFLEPLEAERLQAVGQRHADAGVVLVVAGAADDVGATVQEEALPGVEGEGAQAERGGDAVDDPAGDLDGGDELVEAGAFGRPEDGDGNGGRPRHLGGRGGGDNHLGGAANGGDRLAVGADDGPDDRRVGWTRSRRWQGGSPFEPGGTAGGIVLEGPPHEDAVGGDGQRAGLDQPGVAVDPGALVEPALGLGGVDPHGHDVAPAGLGDVGDVVAEPAVAALVVADEPAVDEDRSVAVHAVELEPEAPTGLGGGSRQRERPAVPGDAVLREGAAEGLEAVPAVAAPIEGQLDGPIVREVDAAPARVAEHDAGRTDARAGLRQVLAGAPVVAEVEFPSEVEEQALAGRGGAGDGRGQRLGARERGGRQGEEDEEETFHRAPSIPQRV